MEEEARPLHFSRKSGSKRQGTEPKTIEKAQSFCSSASISGKRWTPETVSSSRPATMALDSVETVTCGAFVWRFVAFVAFLGQNKIK